MASISTTSGWMTNFIYEQDLTSAYMDSMLYSMFRPGVYNANMYITPDSSSGDSSATQLTLHIRKGTTLVFSNDYKRVSTESGYRRNWTGYNENDSGSFITDETQLPILIKCTAIKDVDCVIAVDYNISSHKDKSTGPWDGTSEIGAPEALYLTAFIRYEQDGTNKTSNERTPIFCLNRNNPFYENTTKKTTVDSEADKFFFYHTDQKYSIYSESSDLKWQWRLPDGSQHYGGEWDESKSTGGLLGDLPKFSYLMVGVILDKEYRKYTGETGTIKGFTMDWLKSHTFSGRCLPEYRHNLIGYSNSESPDFILPLKFDGYDNSTKFSRLYIDFKDIINYGNLYSTTLPEKNGNGEDTNDLTWERAYQVGYSKLLKGDKNTDYISYVMSEDEVNSLPTGDNIVVVDFTFACSQSNINVESDNISGMFSKSNNLKLFNHREVFTGLDSLIIDKITCNKFTSKTSEGSNIKDALVLDLSEFNTSRLYSIIRNKNILPLLINKIRQSGELNPVRDGESLIPVAIAFRLFSKVSKEGETVKISALDDITSVNSVNPSNVLSLLDMNYRMTKLNPIASKTQDAYSILPIIK